MSTHPPLLSERQRLRKRAAYFFGTHIRARDEVSGFAAELSKLGRSVVIGGFLRDLCLTGNRDFKSDVDFVVDAVSTADLDRLARRLGARTNRFGGYEIRLARWKVDVWPLDRTWAAVEGHVSVSSLGDLLKVTFFDWDAVLYTMDRRELITNDRYFDRVQSRLLDINLEPNPNPLGNAVRALRYACRWRACFGQTLALHVSKQIRDHTWAQLVATERRSFGSSMLGLLDEERVVKALSKQLQEGRERISVPMVPKQHELQFGTHSAAEHGSSVN